MITADRLKTARWNALFLDGQGFWEQRRACVDFPRLAIVDRGPRGRALKSGGVQRTRQFFVDGREFASLEAAIDALNQPAPETCP